MTVRHISAAILTALLGASTLTACGSAGDDQTLSSTGTASLPLTAVGPDGTLYRLEGTFVVTGAETTQEVVSGDEATIDLQLPVGSYGITLSSAWQLLALDAATGEELPVDAQLVSPLTQSFAIADRATTNVRYVFSVGGVELPLGQGVARIGIEVVDGGTSTTTTTTTTTPVDAGYWTSGNWHGYAFTAAQPATSTISPASYEDHAEGAPFCAGGVVAPMSDYSGIAMVGFNLNQAPAVDAPADVVVPTGSGILVNLDNAMGTVLRLQLQGPTGSTNASDRWCANIPTDSGPTVIPYSSFNTRCWDNSGAPYQRQPLQSAMVLVPGNTSPVPFDFCVRELGER